MSDENFRLRQFSDDWKENEFDLIAGFPDRLPITLTITSHRWQMMIIMTTVMTTMVTIMIMEFF